MKMKKLLAVFACMLLTISLAACAEQSGSLDSSAERSQEAKTPSRGLNGKRFSSGASEDEVREWVESLG